MLMHFGMRGIKFPSKSYLYYLNSFPWGWSSVSTITTLFYFLFIIITIYCRYFIFLTLIYTFVWILLYTDIFIVIYTLNTYVILNNIILIMTYCWFIIFFFNAFIFSKLFLLFLCIIVDLIIGYYILNFSSIFPQLFFLLCPHNLQFLLQWNDDAHVQHFVWFHPCNLPNHLLDDLISTQILSCRQLKLVLLFLCWLSNFHDYFVIYWWFLPMMGINAFSCQ